MKKFLFSVLLAFVLGNSTFFYAASSLSVYDLGRVSEAGVGQILYSGTDHWLSQSEYNIIGNHGDNKFTGAVEGSSYAAFGSLGSKIYTTATGGDPASQNDGQAWARWQDTWTISNSSLNGKAGSLQVQYNVNGQMTLTNLSELFWQYQISGAGANFLNLSGELSGNYMGQTYSGKPIPSSGVFTMPFIWGKPFDLQAVLWARAITSPNYPGHSGTSTGFSDFYDTATINVLGAYDNNGHLIENLTFLTDSGHEYRVVPIPSSLLLFGPAIAGVIWFRKRARI